MIQSTKKAKATNNELKNLIENHSFKIKPIYLELYNYSYYHTAISEDDKDENGRFVGRKTLINKIKSFVHESTNNTGTFLISGFRGMGKTSLINKALADLNTNSKLVPFVNLWLSLLLIVVRPSFFINIPFKVYLIINFIVLFIHIGSFMSHVRRIAKDDFVLKKMWFAFISLFIDGFKREKFVFLKYTKNIFWITSLFSSFIFLYKDPFMTASDINLDRNVIFYNSLIFIIHIYF